MSPPPTVSPTARAAAGTDASEPQAGCRPWSEAHFRPLVEHSRDLICLHTPDGRYRYASPSALPMLGYRPEELIGANPYDFFHPEEDLERLRRSHENVLAGRVDDTVRYRFRRRNGSWAWLETLAVPLFEDGSDTTRLTSMLTSSRDVSGQVESDAQRATSEERLRLALRATGTGICDLRLPEQTGWYSAEYARVFGFGPEALPIFAAGWQPLVHADDLPGFLAARRRLLRGEQDEYELEVRRLHSSGRWLWVRFAAQVVEKDAAGLPRRLIGTLHDIDERARSTQALLDSRHRLAQSQRLARLGDWRSEVDQPRELWSDEIYRILGLVPEETVPSFDTFLACLHPDDREAMRQAERIAQTGGGAYERDLRVIRPDGSERHVYHRSSVLRNAAGRYRGLFGTLQDITERKQAEAALRQTAAALEQAQRLARVGSWHWQIEGDRVSWSRELFEIFGRDPAVPPPPYAEQAVLYTPESWQRRRTLVAQSLLSGAPFETEVEIVRADGTRGWGLSRGEVRLGSGGRAVGMSGTLQDITERKHTEIALREARDQVRELSGHLEDELNQERKRIALDVHDELGQMLTAMKLQLELLQSQLGEPARARQTGERLRELIEETMEVTRNVALNLRPPALDLGLAAALEWLAEDFGLRTEIACAVQVPAADVPLSDKQATALFRIAQESLTNVTRHAQAQAVHIGLALAGRELALEIRDDGVGFDTAAALPPGHFGLLGMRERALRLGAALRVESRPGAGCTVRVVVQLHAPEAAE